MRLRPYAMLLAVLTGCAPHDEPPTAPDPTIFYSFGIIAMSGGNWDLPASIDVGVRAYSYARMPTVLSLVSAELYLPTDLQTPLATLSLTVESPQLQFAAADYVDVNLVNDGTVNRVLSTACGPVKVVLVFHSSSCNCNIRVEGDDSVLCYADNGADPELAAVGEPAPAGKPCGSRSYVTTSGVEELDVTKTYRYDTSGRLLFADTFDGTTQAFQERTFYTYDAGTFLSEVESISPSARAVTTRSTYGYVDGVLSTISRDGDVANLPDGVPDATWTYGFTGNDWTVSDGTTTTAYAYDPSALTVTRSDAVFLLAQPIDVPSRFFATTFLDAPKVLSADYVYGTSTSTVTYTWNADSLLEVRSSELLGTSFRDEYLYSCQ